MSKTKHFMVPVTKSDLDVLIRAVAVLEEQLESEINEIQSASQSLSSRLSLVNKEQSDEKSN
jgi:hypothetical protein